MSWLDGWRHRLRTLFDPRGWDESLQEEMDHHLSLDAASGAAVRRFGNRTVHREATRELTLLRHADAFARDVRHTWRSLRRSPGVAIIVVVTLALGIGANVAAFTLLDEFYLRPPAGVRDAASLRRLWVRHMRTGGGASFTSPALSYPLAMRLAPATGDSAGLALFFTDWSKRMGARLDAPRLRVVYATASYFSTLGVQVAAGRAYTAAEDRMGAPVHVAVVSDAFWRRQLGGDPKVLGRPLMVDTTGYTIVGVLDPAFTGLDPQAADVWVPLASVADSPGRAPWYTSPRAMGLQSVARIAPSFEPDAFATQATQLLRTFNREALGAHADTLAQLLTGGLILARGPAKPGQELVISTRLGIGAVLLLLIAIANVVNLLLARALARRREIALRLSLGMSRGQLVRLLSIEPVLLALLATMAATVVGAWSGSALRTLVSPDVEWQRSLFDGRIVAFTAIVGLAAGVVSALIPALVASRHDLATVLAATAPGSGTRQRSRLRQGMVMLQSALSVVLILGSVLFIRSLRNVEDLDIGFDSRQMVFGRVRFVPGERPPAAILAGDLAELAGQLRARPGVEEVALTSMEPMRGFGFLSFFVGADSAGSYGPRSPTFSAVSPEFFRATGMRVLQGQGFSEGSLSSPREVVVNQAMAEMIWPGRSALGACMIFEDRANPCYNVVGVVENVRLSQVIEPEPTTQFYLPVGNVPEAGHQGTTLVVRTMPGAIDAVSGTMRTLVKERWPAAEGVITPMSQNLEPEYRPWRLGAILFTTFGLLALTIALVGIYSTVSYGVSQRRREFGVRLALGAPASRILQHVVGNSVRTVAGGAVLGAATMVVFGRLIADLLYGVSPGEPITLALVTGGLLFVAACSALIPAARAAGVNPVETLRAD